ncbi:MAG: hypothetical protein H7Y36_07150 [Armatimonadetes bacterium]|nr:hypothetical protein [Akkermansiaceae bacterium]
MILCFAVLMAGALRLPFERTLTVELQQANLLPAKLEVKTGARIGQTFSAVSLGGLRTLVATFLNLRAFAFFSEQRWEDVAESYDTIVDLAPRTRYYWDTGSWHQAYNAASYYLYESDLPPLRRKLAWRESILKGRDFLERAIQNNPDDWQLLEALGFLLSDANKIAAFGSPGESYEKAYEAYKAAVDTGNARAFTERAALYSLARVPGRETEALTLARKVEKDLDHAGTPTLYGLLYVLEYYPDPNQDVMKLVDTIFESRKQAYEILGNQWLRTRDHFPVHGIARAITLLEAELQVSEAQSVLKHKLQSPMNPEEEF